jgi:hypothetical protein
MSTRAELTLKGIREMRWTFVCSVCKQTVIGTGLPVFDSGSPVSCTRWDGPRKAFRICAGVWTCAGCLLAEEQRDGQRPPADSVTNEEPATQAEILEDLMEEL